MSKNIEMCSYCSEDYCQNCMRESNCANCGDNACYDCIDKMKRCKECGYRFCENCMDDHEADCEFMDEDEEEDAE